MDTTIDVGKKDCLLGIVQGLLYNRFGSIALKPFSLRLAC